MGDHFLTDEEDSSHISAYTFGNPFYMCEITKPFKFIVSEVAIHESNKKKVFTIIGVIGGILVIAAIIIVYVFY